MKKIILTYWPIWTALFAAHFLLLLATGSNWDGALLAHLAETGDMATIHQWMRDSGLYPHDFIYRGLAGTGFSLPFTARATSFLFLGLASMAVYRLLTEHAPLHRMHALIICQIMVAWPFLHMLMIETMVAQVILMACFYWGWLIYLRAGKNIGLRISGCSLIILSFYHGLYLLTHLALFAVLCSVALPSWKNFLRAHGWMIILPFAFFIVKQVWAPISGAFVDIDYNIPLILRDDMGFIEAVSRTLWLALDGIRRNAFQPFYMVGTMYKAWPLLLVVMLVAGVFLWRRPLILPGLPRRACWWVIISGALLFCAVIFTHALVGQYTQIFTPSARHGTHAGLGFGIIALGLLLKIPDTRRKLKSLIIIMLIAHFAIATIFGHALWIARQAKDFAVVLALSKMPQRNDVSIYYIEDIDFYGGLNWKNDFFERTIMMRRALDRKDVLGSTIWVFKEKDPKAATQHMVDKLMVYNFTVNIPQQVDSRLCAALIKITTDNPLSDTRAAFQYLYNRWLDKNALNTWLEALVQVDMKYINLYADDNTCEQPVYLSPENIL